MHESEFRSKHPCKKLDVSTYAVVSECVVAGGRGVLQGAKVKNHWGLLVSRLV